MNISKIPNTYNRLSNTKGRIESTALCPKLCLIIQSSIVKFDDTLPIHILSKWYKRVQGFIKFSVIHPDLSADSADFDRYELPSSNVSILNICNFVSLSKNKKTKTFLLPLWTRYTTSNSVHLLDKPSKTFFASCRVSHTR